MAARTLSDLYVEQLRDLYNAERQILKALPKIIKAASHDDLKEALESHRQETGGHVTRLEQIFEFLGKNAKGKTCHGMTGVLAEGAELIEEEPEPEVLDAGIISAAQRRTPTARNGVRPLVRPLVGPPGARPRTGARVQRPNDTSARPGPAAHDERSITRCARRGAWPC